MENSILKQHTCHMCLKTTDNDEFKNFESINATEDQAFCDECFELITYCNKNYE